MGVRIMNNEKWFWLAVIVAIIAVCIYKTTSLVLDRQADMLRITLQSAQQVIEK